MITSTNLGLNLPEGSDVFNYETFLKQNFEKLDTNAGKIVEATTTYYVATTGNNANDGKTVGTAFATLQKAFDTISQVYTVIKGVIKIDIQAGTYAQTSMIPSQVRSANRIQIIGKKDVNGIPTVIFDGNGLDGSGIFGQEQNFLLIQDMKFQNYKNAGVTACGIHVQNSSNLWTNNVHIYDCDWGISCSVNCRLYVQGGIIDTCKFGVRHYSGCVGTIGYKATSLADGTLIKNCSQAGVYHQNQSSSHVDWCTLEANTSGVACVNQSRAHCMKSNFINNVLEGVYCYHQSTWMNDGNTFSGNPRKWRLESFSSELSSFNEARSSLNTYLWTGSVTLSNTTSLLQMKGIYTMLGGDFVTNGRKLKIVAMGSFGGTGTKSVSIRLSPDGNLASVTSSSTAGGSWRLEVELFAVTATSQKMFCRWIEGDATTATTKTFFVNQSSDFSVNQAINVYGQPTTTAGTITLEVVEVHEII